jgi:hypothetical protein
VSLIIGSSAIDARAFVVNQQQKPRSLMIDLAIVGLMLYCFS